MQCISWTLETSVLNTHTGSYQLKTRLCSNSICVNQLSVLGTYFPIWPTLWRVTRKGDSKIKLIHNDASIAKESIRDNDGVLERLMCSKTATSLQSCPNGRRWKPLHWCFSRHTRGEEGTVALLGVRNGQKHGSRRRNDSQSSVLTLESRAHRDAAHYNR